MQRHHPLRQPGSRVTRRTFLESVAGVAGAAAGTLGFPAVVRGQAREIKVGHIHPLTGPVAVDGISMKNGIALAFDQINAAGGIKALGGARLRLVSADSEGKPQTAAAEAERLIRDGVVAIIGAWLSSNTLVTTPIAERNQIPQLIELSIVDQILARGFKYSFRITYGSGMAVQKNVEYIKEIAKATGREVKTAVYLHEDSAYGTSLGEEWEKVGPRNGIQLLARIPYSSKTADLTSEVSKAKALNPDVLLSSGYRPDSILLVRTLAELKANFLGVFGCQSAGFYHPTFHEAVGKPAEFLFDTDQGVSRRSPHGQRLQRDYKTRYNEDMALGAAYAYTAALVLKDALERAGTTEGPKLRDAIAATSLADHPLPQAEIRFDATGQNVNAAPVGYQWQGKDIRIVWPPDQAEVKPIFPVPRWEQRG
jgi:branched-chain amino acid transport system substrate-binding protein